jgi:hypothetical protein
MTYQQRRTAADSSGRRFVICKRKAQVWRKSVVPHIQFFRQRRKLLQREIVRRTSGIDLLQYPGENTSSTEECESTRHSSVLTRARRLEPGLVNILLISVMRLLTVDVLILELFGKTQRDGGEAGVN